MPATLKRERLTSHPGSDLRQLSIQHNNAILDLMAHCFGLTADMVLGWSSVNGNSLQPLGRGSTDTRVANGAFRFIITGQAASEAKAAVAAGTAFSAQTVPADTWAIYAFDVATSGTIGITAGAANATTGYATEALAIAACPARLTVQARMGYVTLKTKAATAWVAATDALAGGASGNPASTTNYYPAYGCFGPSGTPANCDNSDGKWNGTFNGVLIPSVLSRGSTDTRVALTAFTYNASGACNIAKAAVAAGAAFGALGTIPADKWGLIVMLIDGAGTQTFLSAADNYGNGYATEAQAIGALSQIVPTVNTCMFGYVTIKTKAATAFIVGTDALAGGSSGNPASGTNYYPTAGVSLPTSGPGFAGIAAAQLAQRMGAALTSANY